MKKILVIILILAVVGIIAGVLFYKFYINKPHENIEKAKPDFVLTAQELYNEFINDHAATSAKYNGKVLELTGSLTKIEKPDTLVLMVFVFNEGMFGDEGIRCTMLPSHNEKALSLAPGSIVKMKGYCAGFNEPDVILEKCSLVEE